VGSGPALPARISLIGFMGSGKTTVGRILARVLGLELIDLDSLIEQGAGASVAQIFAEHGEQAFRDREAHALASLASREGIVVAAGGGAPVQERNREFFERLSTTFYLRVSLATARRRTRSGVARPLLGRGEGAVRALYEKRLPVYRSFGAEVDTEGRTPEEVAGEILRLLGRPTGSDPPAGSCE
jgi:shikimate kinase